MDFRVKWRLLCDHHTVIICIVLYRKHYLVLESRLYLSRHHDVIRDSYPVYFDYQQRTDLYSTLKDNFFNTDVQNLCVRDNSYKLVGWTIIL